MKKIGYDRPLFVQPFDHRGSFFKKFFHLGGPPQIQAVEDQVSAVVRAKTLIYRGLLQAIDMGVDPATVGILIDAQFGGNIIVDAKARGIPVAVCTEKSGQPVFDFEYGGRWTDHIRFFAPDMVKCLVRYHPKDDPVANREQATRLKMLSDYIHSTDDCHFMFELLVPATTDEDKAAGADYDTQVRPGLMVEAIRELQELGVEPDVWKIEGLDRREDAEAVAEQARSGDHRADVGCVILGRGSDAAQVHKWLAVAAPVDGFIGFAVGRTNFSEPLKKFLADPSQEAAAVAEIASNYKGCVDAWLAAQ
jgi:myo-inositol catabolism protein IolC